MPGARGDARGIDLNTASRQELDRIGGIGRERSEEIIRSRPFRDWNDLKQRVPGFSNKLVEDLRQAGATIGGTRAKTGGGGR